MGREAGPFETSSRETSFALEHPVSVSPIATATQLAKRMATARPAGLLLEGVGVAGERVENRRSSDQNSADKAARRWRGSASVPGCMVSVKGHVLIISVSPVRCVGYVAP